MTKAKNNHMRKLLLAASLILASSAAHAQSYVAIALPTWLQNGDVVPVAFASPLAQPMYSSATCSSVLTNYKAYVQQVLNYVVQLGEVANPIGGCFLIGPKAGTLPDGVLHITWDSYAGAGGSLQVPTYTTATCNNALATIKGAFNTFFGTVIAYCE